MATREGEGPETRWMGSLLVVYMSVLVVSSRCQKDSSSACKGANGQFAPSHYAAGKSDQICKQYQRPLGRQRGHAKDT
jgi:hypothetical protein